jgi:hypothetical protein
MIVKYQILKDHFMSVYQSYFYYITAQGAAPQENHLLRSNSRSSLNIIKYGNYFYFVRLIL